MRRTLVLLAALITAACGGSGESSSLPQGRETVKLDPGDFSAEIDNPYWPMRPGSRWVYRELDPDGAKRVEVTVLDRTEAIEGIEACVVHDVVSEGGKVVEDTYDWYAQDGDGNVWYVGEDTKEYEDGKVSAKGSWKAGVDGAQAGIALPGTPEVGQDYRQEYYAGEAEDMGRVLSLDEWVDVPAGTYRPVLMTKDWTPLEPDALEHKFYAKGIGPVLTVSVAGPGREELVTFRP
ncbi:MAG: hypothetical protein ACJ75P_07720 [Gaiellaceae bacterium]